MKYQIERIVPISIVPAKEYNWFQLLIAKLFRLELVKKYAVVFKIKLYKSGVLFGDLIEFNNAIVVKVIRNPNDIHFDQYEYTILPLYFLTQDEINLIQHQKMMHVMFDHIPDKNFQRLKY